ncbi:hypothetical protein I302_108222 [Kwoniella bestiolae CBS 10118]|uniref:Uncharacterized protein n=1 Tax=Kwoniella bestiolae CBS 10118 TaxID=1296100 RepID=A0A1B9FWA9_9TREE|nr:hypothetical protein I302_07413 [Kwoniella bestiolae CBS 10118]OCF23062.1 hypothetical protein I302_07413 [Kwoniella bestiolae CBS 10118]
MSSSSTQNKSLVPTNAAERQPVFLHLDTLPPTPGSSNDTSADWADGTLARMKQAATSTDVDPSSKGFKLETHHGYSVLTCKKCDQTHVFFNNELNTEDVKSLDGMINGRPSENSGEGETLSEEPSLLDRIKALKLENERLKSEKRLELISKSTPQVSFIKFRNVAEEDDTFGSGCLACSQEWAHEVTEADCAAISSCCFCCMITVSSIIALAVTGFTGMSGASCA